MHPKKIIKIVVIILLPLGIQLFASGKNKMRPIKEVIIDHQDEDMYVTDETIRRTIFKDPISTAAYRFAKVEGDRKSLR